VLRVPAQTTTHPYRRNVRRAVAGVTAPLALATALGVGAQVAAADDQQARPVDREAASIGVRRPAEPLSRPPTANRPPPSFRLTPRRAVAIAGGAGAVSEARSEHGRLEPRAYVRGSDSWQVSFYAGGVERAQVYVDDRGGRVLEAWEGPAVDVFLARGYEGAFGGSLNSPWLWLSLCVLFVLPFVDPRRPLRLLHLDLLVLLSFGISQAFFNAAKIELSVALVYPVLGYILVRMLVAAWRPSRPRGPLVPFAPPAALALGLVLLLGLRIGLNVVDSSVIDVGYAGVIGADRIEHGQEIYDGSFPEIRGDTYGPLTYLAYIPFEQLFPWSGTYDDLPAAHAAAIAFDLLTVVGLLLLGRRLRPGRPGTLLGLALAYAWAAYPYTALTLQSNANDALLAALLVFALVAVASAPVRGALAGAGAAAKAVPLAVAPLLARGTGRLRVRSGAIALVTLAGVLILTTLPFLPDGGLRELYDRTIGYQAARGSPFSVWNLEPAVAPLRTPLKLLVAGLALATVFVPRRRDAVQVAALGAAVIVAVQILAGHWFYIYAVWFAPFAFVALLAPHVPAGNGGTRAQGTDGEHPRPAEPVPA